MVNFFFFISDEFIHLIISCSHPPITNIMLGTRICPKQENLPKVCPRSRRHPLRRKNCALMLGGALLVFAVMQFLESEDDWSMLRPLADAESEAKRLLKMMLNYQLQCNSTFHLGNHSAWPLCTEHDTGVDLDAHYNHRLFYSVGWVHCTSL